jgi:uroporphyrinogen-III decarboxylase
MPVGAHLVLHLEPDPEAVEHDGPALGRVIAKTARRFGSPLAIPLMDLQLEKAALLRGLDIAPAAAATYHFGAPPTDAQMDVLRWRLDDPLPRHLQAQVEAVQYVAKQEPDLVPCSMTIGPFSLMTKLLADPIGPVYSVGQGVTAAEDEGVAAVERCLELAMLTVERSLRAQLDAGATLAFVAEPAANKVYISPRQMEKGSDIFDRLVMTNLRRYKAIVDEYGADLLLHDCGELTDAMISALVTVDPAVLSLGSSRPLWEVAPLVPATTVLYGNLPSKKFYSDTAMTIDQVTAQTAELIARMKVLHRPFILGSECDVLHVPGCEGSIWSKVDAFMRIGKEARPASAGAA